MPHMKLFNHHLEKNPETLAFMLI